MECSIPINAKGQDSFKVYTHRKEFSKICHLGKQSKIPLHQKAKLFNDIPLTLLLSETFSRSLSEETSTRCMLRYIGMSVNEDYPFYVQSGKDIAHFFIPCGFTNAIWLIISKNCPIPTCGDLRFIDWMKFYGK